MIAILTVEQKDVVRNVVKDVKQGEKQIVSVGGHAGCGKTTCLGVISQVLPNFAICAYTGKAANVLRKKGITTSTIHSLIYKPMMNERGGIEFFLKEPPEMCCDGFLVDEASMVSKEIYEDLLTFGLPIVFVGDHGQLEPVGFAINVMAEPMYRLETVHRNAGEIAHFAEHIRKGNKARTFHPDHKVEFVEPSAVTDTMLMDAGQMICAYNKTRVGKNARVRELQGYTNLIEKGEKVMCLRNNKGRGLFNGMQGIISKIHPKHPKFDFRSDGVTYLDILYDPRQFGQEKNQFEFGKDSPEPFDYAYCITAHKSQGDEWSKVTVFEQECSKWDHKRWAYTCASRAKESLVWICENRYVPDWL